MEICVKVINDSEDMEYMIRMMAILDALASREGEVIKGMKLWKILGGLLNKICLMHNKNFT